MSSKSTTSYVALVKLIEACGNAGVNKIKVNNVEIDFYENGSVANTSQVTDEPINIFTNETVDLDSDVGDNGETDDDATLSDDVTIDTLEDMMFTDPLLYEETVLEIANDKDR